MKFLIPVILFVRYTTAIIESISAGCDEADTSLINKAITDALTVVTDVRNQLLTFNPLQSANDDPRSAIYVPLFKPEDLPTIISHLKRIQEIKTEGYKVRIYCDSSTPHIEWLTDPNSGQEFWADTDFYHNPKQNEKRSIAVGVIPGMKPAGSWTKHGYEVNPNFDCSNQAHVQLATKIIRGTRAATDNRDLVSIRRDGLGTGPNFNVLDFIRPLTRTVIHELFHVVGGLDAINRPIVIDVKNPNAPRNYGLFWECVSQKNALFSSVRQAECLATLVVGMYLDNIQDKPAFWSLGVVDRTTLKPIGLPAAASQTKVKHRALRLGLGLEVKG